MNEKHTPGPWRIAGKGTIRKGDNDWIADIHWRNREANARLIVAAPDHAMICWAMCVGAGRWEPFGDGRGEFCMNGLRHATKLDEFGCPVVTESMRAALAKAVSS